MLLLLAMSTDADAGPWVRDPGGFYLKGGYVRFASSNYVDPQGQEVTGTEYVGNTHHLYGEIGLFEPIQVMFNAPFVVSRNTGPDLTLINRDLGDFELGLEGGTSLGNSAVGSLLLKGKIPLYDNAELLDYGADGGGFPAIGDGQVDLSALGAVGTGLTLGSLQGFTALETGWQWRTEAFVGDSSNPDRAYGDGIPWRLQLGWSPQSASGRSLGWLSADYAGFVAVDHVDTTKQWMSLSVGGGWSVTRVVNVEAGISTLPWARASAQGSSISLGVSANR